MPVIDNLIRQLDRKSQQVEIEARVVAANRTFSREIGTQFGISARQYPGHSVRRRRSAPSAPSPITLALRRAAADHSVQRRRQRPTSGPIPLLTNLPALPRRPAALHTLRVGEFRPRTHHHRRRSPRASANCSRSPKVITQNNQKATVKQGTKIPVQTIVNNTVSVQFVDAVLELDVTPQITADGTVYMDVTVENDQIDNAIPRFRAFRPSITQSAETKVTVNDGATVVIGGIIVTHSRPTSSRCRCRQRAGDRQPVQAHDGQLNVQELLFFLTPRILPG